MNTLQKLQVINKFYKDAFCIDGEVKLIYDTEKFEIQAVLELNDSKRGKFYMGILKNKKEK